jgi:hypothetical protein
MLGCRQVMMGEGVTMARSDAGRWVVRGAVIGFLALGAVGCGQAADTGTEVIPPAPLSPTTGEFPEETNQATATIANGSLQPDRYAGQIGTAFRLIITGDGTQHTLQIQDLVDETTIAATGDTSVAFTIAGEPGDSEITLDGKRAGTFERQAASGATD